MRSCDKYWFVWGMLLVITSPMDFGLERLVSEPGAFAVVPDDLESLLKRLPPNWALEDPFPDEWPADSEDSALASVGRRLPLLLRCEIAAGLLGAAESFAPEEKYGMMVSIG